MLSTKNPDESLDDSRNLKMKTKKNSDKKTEMINHFSWSVDQTRLTEVLLVISVVLTFQLALGLGSYSGEGKPPLFGDYEAQRHWMEITINLPLSQWYVNGISNDLLYWGLDYPPLTAYHSYLMGFISQARNESWVSLEESRGHESPAHKRFMRLSAIIPFHFLYLPPLFLLCESALKKESGTKLFALAAMYPGLLVIDNGHFQYNSVSLGLFLCSVLFLQGSSILLGSVFFVLALNYKQMELYHALPIFLFILSRSIKKPVYQKLCTSFISITKVGLVVIMTFLIIWAPFIINGTWMNVFQRIFPFYRGIYEDKVASFWCAFSFIFKRLPEQFQKYQIVLSTLCVLLFSAPSLVKLFCKPTAANLHRSLFAVSLSFFLFSFHVHEKTILQPAAASLLLLYSYPEHIGWFLHISNVSLFSLCIKDENAKVLVFFIGYYVATCVLLKNKSSSAFGAVRHLSSIIGIFVCLLEVWAPVPKRYPDIYALLNAVFCCVHFLFFLIFITREMFQGEQVVKKKKVD